MFRYNINPDSEIPVYRQLVDQINAQIRSGSLKTGTQLPTVREMAEQLHLSCGTVKRVYDRLREMGDIEMTRRRGTFVKYVRQDGDSRKLQAMTAIDRMIHQLCDLNFSPSEIQIFLNLKMREWGLKWSGIRIAVATEYTELGAALERQLSRIGNVKVLICSIRQLREYPYNIDEECEVILASPEDAQKLLSVLPDRSKLVKVAFELQMHSVFALSSLAGKRLGVLCEEDAFADLVRSCLPDAKAADLTAVHPEDVPAADVDVLVVPPAYTANCSPELCAWLEGMQTLVFDYAIDQGSMIYLEERISRIREERQLRPGTLSF